MELTENQKRIVQFMLNREKNGEQPVTAAEIGEAINPTGVKDSRAWGRDNIRRMEKRSIVEMDDNKNWVVTSKGRPKRKPNFFFEKFGELIKKRDARDQFLDAVSKLDKFSFEIKRERQSHLEAYRASPKPLRQIGKKGSFDRRILIEFTSMIDGRVHRYHATKGWRSSRVTS